METKPSHESYTEYEYYDVPSSGIIETRPKCGPKGVLTQGINDEEYLYEKPISCLNRMAIFSSPDIVYYDVEPDNFEPEGEYVIDQMSHAQKNLQNSSSTSTNGQLRAKKEIQQDVYDEDGYTLARPESHDDEHVPEVPKMNERQKQTEKPSDKKFLLFCIGIL